MPDSPAPIWAPPALRRAGPPALAAALVAAALFVAAWTIKAQVDLYAPLPFQDQWATVREVGERHAGDWSLRDWWRQHNEHRPVVSRLLFHADYWLLGGRNILQYVLMPVVQGLTALLLFAGAVALLRGTPWRSAALAGIAAVLVALQFSSAQVENFLIGFTLQVSSGHAFAIAAFGALALASRHRGAAHALLVALSIGCAVACHLSVANGVIAWTVLVVMALWLRLPPGSLAAVAFTGALLTAAYFVGYDNAEGIPGPLRSLEDPARFVRFFALLLGGPFGPLVERTAARLLGVLGVLLYALLAWHAYRHHGSYPRAAVFLFATATFAILTAALITLGRSPLGETAATSERYAHAPAILWSCIVPLGWWAAGSARAAVAVRVRAATVTGAAAIVVLSAVMPLEALPPWRTFFGGLEPVEDALRTGVLDRPALARVAAATQLDEVPPLVPILREHGYSIFHGNDDSELFGREIETLLTVREGACIGNFDAAVPAEGAAGYRVVGWAWDAVNSRPAERVLIADSSGRVVGLASAGIQRPDVPAAIAEVTSDRAGWYGYAQPAGTIRAYARMNARLACPLPGEFRAP